MPLILPTRTSATQAIYGQEGERHLRRALRIWPVIACEIEALAVSIEADLTILKPSTVRRYRQEMNAVLDTMAAGKPERAAIEEVRGRIMIALDLRRGRPPTKRTSSRKVRDATSEECSHVLGDLRARAVSSTADELDHLLPAFLVAEPPLGLRPVEWIGAEIVGDVLVVPCAKATNGRACSDVRRIGLGSFEPEVTDAVELMLLLLPGLLSKYGSWIRLRDALAERLARSCRRSGIRRLSPYSFRHVALATWKANGFDPVAIAALTGHKTTRMQKAYAGSRHGWTAEGGLPEPDPVLVTQIAARSNKPSDPVSNGAAYSVDADGQGLPFVCEVDPANTTEASSTCGEAATVPSEIMQRPEDTNVTEFEMELFDPMPTPNVPTSHPARSSSPASTLFAKFTYSRVQRNADKMSFGIKRCVCAPSAATDCDLPISPTPRR